MYKLPLDFFFFFDRMIIAGWSKGMIPGSDPGDSGSIPLPATIFKGGGKFVRNYWYSKGRL